MEEDFELFYTGGDKGLSIVIFSIVVIFWLKLEYEYL